MCVIARSRWAKVRTSQLNWAGPRRAEPNNYPAIRRIAVTPGVCPVTGAWRTVSASQRLIRFLCFSHTAWTHWPLGTHVFDCRHTPLRIIWALLDFYCTPRSKSPAATMEKKAEPSTKVKKRNKGIQGLNFGRKVKSNSRTWFKQSPQFRRNCLQIWRVKIGHISALEKQG